jgi:MFS family permease
VSYAGFSAFRSRGVAAYLSTRLLTITASQMVSVAIGWQVYELTKDPLHLGYVGLAQFLPSMAFSLVSGHTADRFDRRLILFICVIASLAASALLARAVPSLGVIYGVSVAIGVIRAFSGPAGASFLPTLVPAADFGNAVAWSMIGFQAGTVIGPAVGGLVFALSGGGAMVYALAAGLYALALTALLFVPTPAKRADRPAATAESLLAGLAYVFREKVILGAMALDLFAVLLGGATALMPVFARDILQAGPEGLGLLRAAPAVGAGLMALLIAFVPLRRRLGWTLLGGVAVFGLATIVFGLSRNFALSVAALAVAGGADMLSVNIRHTLIQMATPDAMRGRVSAVAFVFIGASNELGEFESGVTARWFGTAPAVVVGGIGTCAVVLLSALLFPQLRKVDEAPKTA